MPLGQRIKEARERLGMTQTELGRKIGMSKAALHALEKRDAQSSARVYELAKVLGTSPEYLLTGQHRKDTIPPPEADALEVTNSPFDQ